MASIEKRIAHNGAISYRVKIRRKGAPPLTKTFRLKSQAQAWALAQEDNIQSGIPLSSISAQKHTLNDAINKYKGNVLVHKKPGQFRTDTLNHLNVWSKYLGAYMLSNITPSAITDARNKLAAEKNRGIDKSPATINRYMASLSVVLSYAVRELEWLENNPVLRVSKLPEPKGRTRYLSPEEKERLLTAVKESANPFLYPIVLIALTTGARKMEILGLRWADIDFVSNCAFVKDTKNGEARTLHLVPIVVNELKNIRQRNISGTFVFPGRTNTQPIDIKSSWETALKKACIPDFRFHDLRHTFASYTAMSGYSMGAIAHLIGHKTMQMTKRYSHFSDAHDKETTNQIAKIILGDTDANKPE